MRARRRAQPAVLITSAPKSRFQQLDDRRRRYLISMGIRTACLLLAIVVPFTPVRILLVIAAVALPWISVVGANAPLPRQPGAPAVVAPEKRRELRGGPEPGPSSSRTAPPGE